MPTATAWEAFWRPVHPENRAHLAELWSGLARELRGVPGIGERQMLGRQWEGCAATIGAMPRCDFGCTACYLTRGAGQTAPLAIDEVRAQLRVIRAGVGRWGNVQLTDGELTLRPTDEVVEIVRAARELELIPMLMTHGDSFRQDPGMLERLMVEGGLDEMSVHVDTTQRGRRGQDAASDELELDPIRDELAQIARDARRRTGRPLRVAATVTVTRANLGGVAGIVRWTLRNSDVMRMLSFQPVADVGRTRDGDGVSRQALWQQISTGLGESMESPDSAWHSDQVFGHPDCGQITMGSVYSERSGAARFVPLRDPTNPRAEAALGEFFRRFGGISFRSDDRGAAIARGLGVIAHAPLFWARRGPGWLLALLRRARPGSPLGTLARLVSGRASLRGMAIVSHHFMDRATLETPLGQAREAACVFRVPIEGELVSMCRVNATDLRRLQYERQNERPSPHALLP